MALSGHVVVVQVAMNHKTFHPELRVVYSVDWLSPT